MIGFDLALTNGRWLLRDVVGIGFMHNKRTNHKKNDFLNTDPEPLKKMGWGSQTSSVVSPINRLKYPPIRKHVSVID